MSLVFLLAIIVLILAALARTATQSRRYTSLTAPRLCRRCALPHPPFAHFCRTCGQKLLP